MLHYSDLHIFVMYMIQKVAYFIFNSMKHIYNNICWKFAYKFIDCRKICVNMAYNVSISNKNFKVRVQYSFSVKQAFSLLQHSHGRLSLTSVFSLRSSFRYPRNSPPILCWLSGGTLWGRGERYVRQTMFNVLKFRVINLKLFHILLLQFHIYFRKQNNKVVLKKQWIRSLFLKLKQVIEQRSTFAPFFYKFLFMIRIFLQILDT
jgi:hypothetical protein